MDQTQNTQTIEAAEILFKNVMKIYWDYIQILGTLLERIPETEEAILEEIVEHIQDVKGAMEYDIGVFDRAIHDDMEDFKNIEDKLQIGSIYKQLKQNG